MKHLAPALAVVAALLGGCNKVTGVVFTVDASGPVSGIARLHGTATLNGGTPAPIDLAHSPAVSIPPTFTFAVQLPDSASGTIDVQLQALGGDGSVLASGGGSATIVPHGVQRNAQVLLTPTGSGLVFDAMMHDFGSVQLAQSSMPFTFTATNMGMDQTGTPAITIDGANAGDFSFTTADCTTPVAASATCTIAVTFSPTATGARSATLHMAATPGGEALATLTGTGMMPSGAAFQIAPKSFLFNDTPETMTGNSTTFTITNIGGMASPTLGNSMITGGMNTSYAITTDGCFAQVLQPTQSCMVTVQFKPVAAGMQTSTLTVAGAGATLNGRGVGSWHNESNTNGGPGAGTFWHGAFVLAPNQMVATATTGALIYKGTPGMPATFVAMNSSPATGAQINQVWGPAQNDIYVVDNKGEVLKFNTVQNAFQLFNASNLFTGGCCTGIWGFGDTNIYVSGGLSSPAGAIAHYDGAWHNQTVNTTLTTIQVNALWGSAANNIYGVGNGGVIVFNNGASDAWTQQTSGTTADLYGIWGSSASDIYAVGWSGNPAVSVILHYDGTSWSKQTYPLTAQTEFNTVWVAPDGEAWIGDLLTAVLHSDGDGTWTDVTPNPAGGEKWQIRGVSDHDVYMFSEDGFIYHYY